MKMIFAAAATMLALQSSAMALDLRQFPHVVKMGDRCRVNVAYLAAYGIVPAGGGQHIMCKVNAYVGTPCYCWFGQYRVNGEVVRNADFADIKN